MMKTITITHVCISGKTLFDDFIVHFEKQLGHHDLSLYQQYLTESGDSRLAEGALKSQEGTSGFMVFATYDHGALLSIKGNIRKAKQYIIGNPLYAAKMTNCDIRTALYAPLRVLIYLDDNSGMVTAEYDLPSSLFGQFCNDQVNETALELDRKMTALIESSFKS
jgi:uncharacterized protein (DUF302 family)